MTFIDWVAPKGAVFVLDRAQRLQGRAKLGLQSSRGPYIFEQALSSCLMLYSPFSYWSQRLNIFDCSWR